TEPRRDGPRIGAGAAGSSGGAVWQYRIGNALVASLFRRQRSGKIPARAIDGHRWQPIRFDENERSTGARARTGGNQGRGGPSLEAEQGGRDRQKARGGT